MRVHVAEESVLARLGSGEARMGRAQTPLVHLHRERRVHDRKVVGHEDRAVANREIDGSSTVDDDPVGLEVEAVEIDVGTLHAVRIRRGIEAGGGSAEARGASAGEEEENHGCGRSSSHGSLLMLAWMLPPAAGVDPSVAGSLNSFAVHRTFPSIPRSFLSTAQAPVAAERPIPTWQWVLGFALVLTFFLAARSHLLLGDAAVYARTIETRHFSERSIHLLYYLVGWLFLQITKPLHLPADTALIAMSSILMTVALWLSWRLSRALDQDARTSRLALFILLFAGVVIQQGTEAEVYSLQLVLTLASYLAYLRNRPVLAGLALGLATLTTPLGVLAVGFFVAELIRTRQWKPFLIMGVVGS